MLKATGQECATEVTLPQADLVISIEDELGVHEQDEPGGSGGEEEASLPILKAIAKMVEKKLKVTKSPLCLRESSTR